MRPCATHSIYDCVLCFPPSERSDPNGTEVQVGFFMCCGNLINRPHRQGCPRQKVTEHDGQCESYAEQGPRLPVRPCGCAARAGIGVAQQPPAAASSDLAVENRPFRDPHDPRFCYCGAGRGHFGWEKCKPNDLLPGGGLSAQDDARAHQGARREPGIARPTYDWAINRLTAMDKQMLELAALGFTDAAMAKKMNYSMDGLKSKWAPMRLKFPPRCRSNRAAMVAWALSRGWIEPLPVDLM